MKDRGCSDDGKTLRPSVVGGRGRVKGCKALEESYMRFCNNTSWKLKKPCEVTEQFDSWKNQTVSYQEEKKKAERSENDSR